VHGEVLAELVLREAAGAGALAFEAAFDHLENCGEQAFAFVGAQRLHARVR